MTLTMWRRLCNSCSSTWRAKSPSRPPFMAVAHRSYGPNSSVFFPRTSPIWMRSWKRRPEQASESTVVCIIIHSLYSSLTESDWARSISIPFSLSIKHRDHRELYDYTPCSCSLHENLFNREHTSVVQCSCGPIGIYCPSNSHSVSFRKKLYFENPSP